MSWYGYLASSGMDLDAAAELAPQALAELARAVPEHGNCMVLLAGWSSRERQALGYALCSSEAFRPQRLERKHAIVPMPVPQALGYARLHALSKAAAVGIQVELFHEGIARNAKWATDAGAHGDGLAVGGHLWLARVSRELTTCRRLADLERPALAQVG
jgi:hypothetical protein